MLSPFLRPLLAVAEPASLGVDPQRVRLQKVSPGTVLNLADWHCNRMDFSEAET